ncbi:MAG: hypothetical protein JWP35_539 [Caulobacter sp.]|nr:hypothetical protein [Caulobacter sp.]
MSEEQPKRKRDNSTLWYATGIAAVVVLALVAKSGFSPASVVFFVPVGLVGIGLGWLNAFRVRRAARNRVSPLDMR